MLRPWTRVPGSGCPIRRPVDRFRQVRELCAGKRVLDLGAYDETEVEKPQSASWRWLHAEIAQVSAEVLGVDAAESVRRAGAVTTRVGTRIVAGSVEDLEPVAADFRPDVVVAGELIEHTQDTLGWLSRLAVQLPGVRLVATTPNTTWFLNVLLALANRESAHQDHLHVYSYRTLFTLAQRVPLRDIEIIPYYFNRSVAQHRARRIGSAVALLDLLLLRPGPVPLPAVEPGAHRHGRVRPGRRPDHRTRPGRPRSCQLIARSTSPSRQPTASIRRSIVGTIRPPLTPRAALRWAAVAPLLGPLRPNSILEIGCGQGAMGALLATHGNYLGIEPNPQSYLRAARRMATAGSRVLNCTEESLPVDTRADLVCAFEVLEHIEDDVDAARRWLRRVNPGGHLLISVPANPAAFGASDVLVGHYRRYTAASLARVLTSAGVSAPLIWHYGWPLADLLDVGRHRVARRRLARNADRAQPPIAVPSQSTTEVDEQAARTHLSGGLLQPGPLVAPLIRAAVAPFTLVQRRFPDRGTGLLALCGVTTVPVQRPIADETARPTSA